MRTRAPHALRPPTSAAPAPTTPRAPQDLRDRTYYLSNGVIRVGGRRVATNTANFTKGDVVGVVLDADQVGGGWACVVPWGGHALARGLCEEWGGGGGGGEV
jgi:hypothetical protein